MSFTIHDQTKCPVCGEKSHSIYQCPSFREQSGSQRYRDRRCVKTAWVQDTFHGLAAVTSLVMNVVNAITLSFTVQIRYWVHPLSFLNQQKLQRKGCAPRLEEKPIPSWWHAWSQLWREDGSCSSGQRLDHLLHIERSGQTTGCQADSKWNRSHRFWKDTRSKQQARGRARSTIDLWLLIIHQLSSFCGGYYHRRLARRKNLRRQDNDVPGTSQSLMFCFNNYLQIFFVSNKAEFFKNIRGYFCFPSRAYTYLDCINCN